MRQIKGNEFSQISGGDWRFGFDAGVVEGEISGTETIQELFSAGVGLISDAYWGARDGMADFFTWWDPAGYYC